MNVIQLDGWKIKVSWHSLYYGQTFFIPSTNWRSDKYALQKSADEARMRVGIKSVVENDVRGLRVWIL